MFDKILHVAHTRKIHSFIKIKNGGRGVVFSSNLLKILIKIISNKNNMLMYYV